MTTRLEAPENDSVWFKAVPTLKTGRPLTGPLSVDVCVVGAGIAGVSCAYHLARAGKKVAVLDLGAIAGGQSAMTTAHLANAADDRYTELERVHGLEGAGIVASSHTAAINDIARITAEENIDCDFQFLDGYLLPAGDPSELDQELEAAHRAGLAGVERLERCPVASAAGSTPCLRFPRQAQFHPLKYVTRLAEIAEQKYGVQFFEAHVMDVRGGGAAHVTTKEGHRVHADSIVVATNSPINDRLAMHTKQGPYTTYVVGIEVMKGSVPTALYWDMEDPYHYVRLAMGDANSAPTDVLVVGGEDHKTAQAFDQNERYQRLEAWARRMFPGLGAVTFKWCGQVMEPVDGVAFIGRNPGDDNVYIVTGDSGMGFTHGAMSGLIITDLIMGRPNPWAKLYDPSRKPTNSLWEFAKENLNAVAQYADWLRPSEVNSTDEIKPGCGAVIRHGVQMIAAYRDENGRLHECSAACPHLGGVVHWNASAKTWDCPVHGSRFDPCGKVVQGPSPVDLEPVSKPVEK